MIDATNLDNVTPPRGFASNAEFVKSIPQRPNHKLVDARAPVLRGRTLRPA